MRIRPAAPEDCDAVAAMVAELAAVFGVTAGTTGDILRAEAFGAAASIGIVVAQAAGGALAGYLVHQDSFSTWRGANGVFVVDLYVQPQWRNDRVGIRLLAEAGRRGRRRGARFMRLDLDAGNEAGLRFYRRHGFHTLDHDRFLVLDEPGFIDLIEKN